MPLIKAPQLATAIYNYIGTNKDELSLRKGDKVCVTGDNIRPIYRD